MAARQPGERGDRGKARGDQIMRILSMLLKLFTFPFRRGTGQFRGGRPLDKLVEDWTMDMGRQVHEGQLADSTVRTYQRGLDEFLDWMDARGLDEISPQAIQSWRSELKRQGIAVPDRDISYAGVERFHRWADRPGLIMRIFHRIFGLVHH